MGIVLIWRLILEEYGSKAEYIQGKKTIVADALSLLLNDDHKKNTHEPNYLT